MKTEIQIQSRKILAECHSLNKKNKKDNKYHQGWFDALEWVQHDNIIITKKVSKCE
jgi:hypothetical protein